MLETLESRRLFSMTVAVDVGAELAPPPEASVDVAASKKPKPKPQPQPEVYLEVKVETVLVSSV